MNKIDYLAERYRLEKKKNMCFGKRGNYYVLYEYNNSYNAYISINITDELKEKIITTIKKLPSNDLISNLEVLRHVIKIKTNIKAEEEFRKFDFLISSILTSLSTNIVPAGREINYKNYYNNNSIGLGIIGALLGAIIGSIVYGIIYRLGYISYIGSIAIAYFTFKGCVLFGKRFGILEAIICVLISLLSIASTLYFSYTVELYEELVKYYDITYFDALKYSFDYFINTKGLIKSFMSDLFSSYLYLAVGYIFIIIDKRKKVKTI